jgi:orotate phosphoribosyltransferase
MMPSERVHLARRIDEQARLTGEFRLRSGAISTEYFDKYRFEADPALLREIGAALLPLVPGNTEVLAGLELGGVPIATVLSQSSGIPARFVRKKAKDYGTCQLVEGGEVGGLRVAIVEDVVTSGGAVLEACRELRALGAQVDTVLCVIDRESGGRENFATVGLQLQALFRMNDLKAAREGKLDGA